MCKNESENMSEYNIKATPFIGCFRTRRGHYVYDVNTNEIIRVPPETYEMLVKVVKSDKGIADIISSDPIVESLREQGYLSRRRAKKIAPAVCPDHYSDAIESRIEQCVLELTQNCNLACRYCCYSPDSPGRRNHSTKTMRWATAKKAIDYYSLRNLSTDRTALSFYGGEPMLEFELLQRCIEYSRSLPDGDRFHLNITTNGTLIDEDVASFFVKNEVHVHVSLDGPEAIHDNNRVFLTGERGTYKATITGLEQLKAAFNDNFHKYVTLNCVIRRGIDLQEIVDFFCNSCPDFLKEKISIRLSPESHPYGSGKRCDVSDCDHCDEPNRAGDNNEDHGDGIRERWLNMLGSDEAMKSREFQILNSIFQLPFLRFYKRDRRRMKGILPLNGMCLPGARKMFVAVDGTILPCERVSERFVIGNIWNGGVDIQEGLKILQYISEYYTRRCLDCIFCRVCGGCLAEYSDVSGWYSEAAMMESCEKNFSELSTVIAESADALERNSMCFDSFEETLLS